MATASEIRMCWGGGHRWGDPLDAKRERGRGVWVRWRCERCTSHRRFLVDADGTTLRREYDYVPGYRWQGGNNAVTRTDARLWLVRETLKRTSASERRLRVVS